MKKHLSRIGALGLTTATLVAGLSIAPAAGAAVPDPVSDANLAADAPQATISPDILNPAYPGGTIPTERFSGPFAFASTRSQFYGYAAVNQSALAITEATTAARAAESSSRASLPGRSEVGPVRLVVDGQTRCVSVGAATNSRVMLATCDGSAAQSFRWVDERNSYVRGGALARADAPSGMRLQYRVPVRDFVNSTFASADVYPSTALGDLITPERFSARVDSVDVSARSAMISGTAVPHSSVVVVGRREVPVGADGTWSHQLTMLPFGTSTVAVEQYENGRKTAETTLEVTLAIRSVTGSVSFPADIRQSAFASGSAHPGASVIVRNPAGTEIARTVASLGSGFWSTPFPAPNAGGDFAIRVSQEIGGLPDGDVRLTVAYGPGVLVTTPVEGATHGGGPVTSSGTGEPGAAISVREQGSVVVIGSTTVPASGFWTVTTSSLDNGTHILETTQTGRGNNNTAWTVALNPDAGEIDPVVVTNPADPTTGYTPNTSFTFTGTATPFKTLQVENKFGTKLADAPVNAQGAWSWTRANMGTSTWHLHFIQDKGRPTEFTAKVLNFAPNAAPAPLVVVTNPADPGLGYTPNSPFTFRGTATARKTITVENKFGTKLADAPVNAQGAWSWTRANMGTSTWHLHFIQDKGRPTEFTAKVLDFAPNAAPAPLVVVTNPADPGLGYTPNSPFTFRGTATPLKTLQVENKFGTKLADAPVNAQGNWTWTRTNMGTSTWHLHFIQDKGRPAEFTAKVLDFAPRG